MRLLACCSVLAVVSLCHAQGPVVKTLIGDGRPGSTGIEVNNVYGLVTGTDGALYFCEIGNHRVSRLDLRTLERTTVAGSGEKGNSGDGGPATRAMLDEPYEVRFDAAGNLFIVDMPGSVVRRVDHASGVITTVAGTGEAGFSGDGGPAVKAQLRQPHSIEFDRGGGLLICDIGNHRIRRVDLRMGTIESWAGTGETRPVMPGVPLARTPLHGPRAISRDSKGNLYVVLREGNAVYRIDGQTGQLTAFAGTGEKGYSGDHGPALKARFNGPKGIACAPDGSVYIADTENHVIRRVDPQGVIATVLGTGARGDGPDGDPLHCQLARPHGIFVDHDGVVYIGDSEAHRVRILR